MGRVKPFTLGGKADFLIQVLVEPESKRARSGLSRGCELTDLMMVVLYGDLSLIIGLGGGFDGGAVTRKVSELDCQ